MKKNRTEIKLPKYVKLYESELRLKDGAYYRDAGRWEVGYVVKENNKVYSTYKDIDDYLHDVELVPITQKEWRKGNKGYIDNYE